MSPKGLPNPSFAAGAATTIPRARNRASKHAACVVVALMLATSIAASGQTPAEDLRRAGVAAYSLYHLAEAERLFRQAVSIAEDNEDHHEAGLDRVALAGVYHAMGRFTEARRAYEEALRIFRREQDFNEVVTVLTGLASISVSRQEFAQAFTYLNEAKLHSRKTGPAGSEAELRTVNMFGLVYFAQEKYDNAEKYFREAVAIASERGVVVGLFPAVGLVETLDNLASVFRFQGKHKIAEETYIRALSLAENAVGSSHPALASMHFNLGSLYLSTDRLANADAQLRRSLVLVAQNETAPAVFVIRNLAMLGKVQSKMGQTPVAEALLTRALEIARRNAGAGRLIPDVLETYSQILQSMHRPAEAWSALEEARQIREEQASVVRVGDLYLGH